MMRVASSGVRSSTGTDLRSSLPSSAIARYLSGPMPYVSSNDVDGEISQLGKQFVAKSASEIGRHSVQSVRGVLRKASLERYLIGGSAVNR